MSINDLIYLQNPWIRDKVFIPQESLLQKRNLFKPFLNDVLIPKQIISLIGLRRVGKSTLIKQVIAQMMEEKIMKTKIFYFSFDQPTIVETKETLETVISFYFEKIIRKNLNTLNEKVYLFFDEIQLIPYWQDILKRYYDINQNIKFIVSGSASLSITKTSKESLAGRIFERYLPPLSFSEYKKLSQKDDFVDYLNYGQFPELLQIEDNTRKIDYLKDGIIGKILEVDIVKTYGIRKTVDFERLFWSLLPNTGQIIQSNRLMTDLQMKKATLFKYLLILEQSLLIKKVLNFSGSFRSETRLLRKLYPASTNFLSLLPEPINKGLAAECYVANILYAYNKGLFFFHKRNNEIDFIIPDEKIAIEVKYQNTIHDADIMTLSNYIKENKYKKGILISKYEERVDKKYNIMVIPIEKLEDVFIQSQSPCIDQR